jgi:hypothetical protein
MVTTAVLPKISLRPARSNSLSKSLTPSKFLSALSKTMRKRRKNSFSSAPFKMEELTTIRKNYGKSIDKSSKNISKKSILKKVGFLKLKTRSLLKRF